MPSPDGAPRPADGKVLLVHLASGVGNLVFATPLLAALEALGHEVDLLLHADYPQAAELFRGWSAVRRVLAVRIPTDEPYGALIPAVPPFYWGRLGRLYAGRRNVVARPPDAAFYADEQAWYLAFARALGWNGERAPVYRLPVAASEAHGVTARTVVLAPGCKTGEMAAKRWPHFPSLAERFSDVAVVGTADDLRGHGGRPMRFPAHVRSLVGRLTLRETAGAMAAAGAVVANDSGLGHAAGAVGAPTVLLFGPTSESVLGRFPDNVAVLRAGLPCEPCWLTGARLRACASRVDCLRALSVDQVESEVRRLLGPGSLGLEGWTEGDSDEGRSMDGSRASDVDRMVDGDRSSDADRSMEGNRPMDRDRSESDGRSRDGDRSVHVDRAKAEGRSDAIDGGRDHDRSGDGRRSGAVRVVADRSSDSRSAIDRSAVDPSIDRSPDPSSGGDDASIPLVSCLMPTRDRRKFVPRAVEHFLRQTHPRRELVVVDDGQRPVEDLLPPDPRIRYHRVERPMMLGAKRNLACSLAAGELLAHWDDDDWMADHRLSAQVRALTSTPGAEACGLSSVRFFDPAAGRAWEYRWTDRDRAWVAGGTLLFRRAAWERRPFPEVRTGEDTRWVWALPPAAVAQMGDVSLYAALVHPGNTSRKRTAEARWHPLPLSAVQAQLGDDWRFYAPRAEAVA